jgi:hypothetical protein
MWTLEKALIVVRAIQPHTRKYNYHLCLGGGVLNKGESNKDLDLYFLPMGGFDGKQQPDSKGMKEQLEKIWGVSEDIAKDYGYADGASCYKFAIKLTRMSGPKANIPQRVDCFIF